MLQPFLPPDEEKRLKTLHDLLVLDTGPESRFDALTAYAAELFEVPIALVSLVDADRQWFKSKCGLSASETPRDISFCGHAILRSELLVVNDTLLDLRFHDNPLVTGEPHIRFYAGAPLELNNGARVGTFCIIGNQPRQLTDWERDHLVDLAKVVARELQGIDAAAAFLDAEACSKFCTMGHVRQGCDYRTAVDGCPRCDHEIVLKPA